MNVILQLVVSLLLGSFVFPEQTSRLHIHIHHANSDQGKILLLVFNQADGFPDQIQKAYRQAVLIPKNQSAELILENIPHGKYAITVLHDEDNSGEMNTNAIGLPTEKYGFSNNPKIYFGPPSFEKSAVTLGAEHRTILINLH